jgi:2-polyprenyl-6-methoxyphenol hydroxylase-like FAD-dependent oxidoreductase
MPGEQVVVVGAGPTGVMLAIELARRGVQVRVLDKQAWRPRETRAIGIHARTLEVFGQLGVVEEFVELGHRVDGATVHSRARRPAQVRFDRLDSPYPFLLTLGQDQTQRILDERLESLGVQIERDVTVLDLLQDRDAAMVRVQLGGERRERAITAGWVVGCDGAHSIVRRSLGVPFAGDDYAQDWLMAEMRVGWPLRRDHFHVFAYTAAPLPMFPLPSGRWRIFIPQVPGRAAEREAPGVEEVERLVAERGPAGMSLSDPSLLATFRTCRRSTRRLRSGRVLVAGDAAHIHSPAGGQGMNIGLQDAFNLGWKLALVAQGQAPAALLDSYAAERVPIAHGVLAFSHGLVRTFQVSSPRRRWVRDRALPAVMAVPAVQRRYLQRISQLSHNYRNGPLAPPNAGRGLAPGDRLPVVCGLVRDAQPCTTLDLLASPLHTLLVLAGDPPGTASARAAIARLNRWDHIVHTIRIDDRGGVGDPGSRAHQRYHALAGRLLLVRPDGYIAATAPLTRPEDLENYLRHISVQDPRTVTRTACEATVTSIPDR